MRDGPATGAQTMRLHTLWRHFCRQSNSDAKDRAVRMGWTAGVIGRQISSFHELSAREANIAIDEIQKRLPPGLVKRKRPSRQMAQAYGTSGRRGRGEREAHFVDIETWRFVGRLRGQLGWTQGRLDAFLRSKHSPTRSGAIRTLAEANRVIWALKSLLRRGKHSPAGGGSTSDLGGDGAATLNRAV